MVYIYSKKVTKIYSINLNNSKNNSKKIEYNTYYKEILCIIAMASIILRRIILILSIILLIGTIYNVINKNNDTVTMLDMYMRNVHEAHVDTEVYRVILYKVTINNKTIQTTYSKKLHSNDFNIIASKSFFNNISNIDLYQEYIDNV